MASNDEKSALGTGLPRGLVTTILIVFFIEAVCGDESHNDADHSKDGCEIEYLAECDRHV